MHTGFTIPKGKVETATLPDGRSVKVVTRTVRVADREREIRGYIHENGGGFVELTAKVDKTAHVGKNAMVLEKAQVRDMARIEGNTVIYGYAQAYDNATVSDAQLYGAVRIGGETVIKGGRFFTHTISSTEQADEYRALLEQVGDSK